VKGDLIEHAGAAPFVAVVSRSQITPLDCNLAKNDGTTEDFEEWLELITGDIPDPEGRRFQGLGFQVALSASAPTPVVLLGSLDSGDSEQCGNCSRPRQAPGMQCRRYDQL
jgi:hypothetical protein